MRRETSRRPSRVRASLDRTANAGMIAVLVVALTATTANGETIRYRSGSDEIEAFVSRPNNADRAAAQTPSGRRPAVLIIHDDLGLNDTIRALGDLFARAGFVALAPNLASRGPGTQAMSTGTQGAGTMNRLRLPIAQTVADTVAAFAFLQEQPDVDATRVSAIGVGWGGFRVWRLAQQAPAPYRAVVFYAVAPTDGSLSGVKAPVLGHYAQHDFILSAGALATQKQMGSRFSYHVYPTGRGFVSGASKVLDPARLVQEFDAAAGATDPRKMALPSGADDYAVAVLALRRTLAFLRE